MAIARLETIKESQTSFECVWESDDIECIWYSNTTSTYYIGHIYESGEMDYFTIPCKTFDGAYALYKCLCVNI